MPAPFSILHLSDLHIGPHCRFAGLDMTKLAERFASSIADALAPGERIGLVIVTGDIAEAGLPRHYAEARAFFDGLVGVLGLPRSRFLFVPGNHDVSWPHCKIAEQQQPIEGFDDAELARRINDVKLQPYRAFLAGFYDCAQGELEGVTPLGHDAFVHGFDDLGVSVALLDSCERENHRTHGGAFGEYQAQALMNVWRQDGDRVRIVAIHHNPLAVVPANVTGWLEHLRTKARDGALDTDLLAHFEADTLGLEGRDLLRRVTGDAQVSLLLHGHHHTLAPRETWTWERRGPGQTHVLAAGSWGVDDHGLPPDQPLAVHLVRVDPAAGSMRSLRLVYEPRARQHGHVVPGDFVIDPAEPDGCPLSLALPAVLHARIAATAGAMNQRSTHSTAQVRDWNNELAARARKLVHELRVRSQDRFARWDLGSVGVIAAQNGRSAIAAGLDEMYLPLRLHPKIHPDDAEAGAPIPPEDLLARARPLVIRGPAGTGKTTWMRWTFRHLAQNEQALPFLIELRDLARKWHDAEDGERTLDAYLHGRVAERVGIGWSDELDAVLPWLLESDAGPRPVLLVDGWDELGDLGDELREKLAGFLRRHPRVLAVVTSRPYGESQPSHSGGYEVLEIQRLSDAEIETMAVRFFGMMHPGNPPAAEAGVVRFRDDLTASQEGLALARTMLTLTMMLLISRARRLPDKRHELYQACIDNLLTARPDDKERDGARLDPVQWRPDDRGERWRAVDALAAQAQLASYAGARRSQIVVPWKDALKLLPAEWDGAEDDRRKRAGFLHWLIDAAGLMLDHADGTVTFSHLSLQEYLTARYLHRTCEGDAARIELCQRSMGKLAWWETLRLWAAMVHEVDPHRLTPVLDALIDNAIADPDVDGSVNNFEMVEDARAAGFWLAGAILADGLGPENAFEHWRSALQHQFRMIGRAYWEESARAWARSRQYQRQRKVNESWAEVGHTFTWLRWLRAEEWCKQAGLTAPSPPPSSLAAHVLAPPARGGLVTNALETAFARVLAGALPWWPPEPAELIFLQLWPVIRPRVGGRLQTFLSLGTPHEVAVPHLCVHSALDAESTLDIARTLARGLAWNMTQDLARELALDLARDWVGLWVKDWKLNFARDEDWSLYFASDWAGELTREEAADWAGAWARYLASYLIHDFARDWTLNVVGDWAQSIILHWGLPALTPWLRDAAWVDFASIGRRAGSRVFMARAEDDGHLLTPLFRAACRASLDAAPDAPRSRQPWHRCRRMWITEHTLDELCASAGLPPLPYLEDLPPEIDLGDLDSDVPSS